MTLFDDQSNLQLRAREALMDATTRIEKALDAALERAEVPECPPKLAAAIRYAVQPGGARIRPRLCLAVAAACGDDHPALTDAAAAAIEILHCASLVHDDLPCFDDAELRRGKPSVHKAFGEDQVIIDQTFGKLLAANKMGKSS